MFYVVTAITINNVTFVEHSENDSSLSSPEFPLEFS